MSKKEGYHWDSFAVWCYKEGVNMKCREDWEPWWDCWCTGINSDRKNNNNKEEAENIRSAI